MRRIDVITYKLKKILKDDFGIEMSFTMSHLSFREIGLDSILLMQFASDFKKVFGLPVSFRQLSIDYDTPERLAIYLDKNLPGRSLLSAPAQMELQLKSRTRKKGIKQADLLPEAVYQNEEDRFPGADLSPAAYGLTKQAAIPGAEVPEEDFIWEPSPKQWHFIRQLAKMYLQKTAASKPVDTSFTSLENNLDRGYRSLVSQLDYPIILKRSEASRFTDLDGNVYIDFSSPALFGHQPSSLKKVLHQLVDAGFDRQLSEKTGNEISASLCEITGSKQVNLYASREQALVETFATAKQVAGKSLIINFSNTICDQALSNSSATIVNISFGDEISLEILNEHREDIAAILLDAIQCVSHHGKAGDFLHDIIRITGALRPLLICDMSGIEFCADQKMPFATNADILIYRNISCDEFPLTAVAYRDRVARNACDSNKNSYISTTLQVQPLSLGVAKFSLACLLRHDVSGYEAMVFKAQHISNSLNAAFERLKVPVSLICCGRTWQVRFDKELPYYELFFISLRDRGINIYEHIPCFINDSHTDADISHIIKCFLATLHEMLQADFFTDDAEVTTSNHIFLRFYSSARPPVEGAKLGRDRDGNPGWFIPDKEHSGNYLQIILK